MRVTIKDVARECGVSAAAVSLVLSGRKSRISEKTKEKIIQAARDLHYHPNNVAAGLARKQSKSVGVVMPDIRNSHIAEMYMGICSVLRKRGYFTVSHLLEDSEPEELEFLTAQIASENLCGLIWAKPFEPDRTEELAYMHETIDSLGIPVLSMGRCAFDSCGIDVCYDYEKAGYLATRYLIEAGHRRIGCISGPSTFEVTRERITGYHKALADAGIEQDAKLIYEGDYTMNSGSAALSYLMGQRVTAIFAQNDEMAFGVYRSARIYGIRIPDELSLIGCDNVPFDDVLEVPLSTISVPAREMGSFIAEQLCNMVEEDQPAFPGKERRRTVYYEPDLYLRGSVGKI